MPSPFPGMDPFIESQGWEDFHMTFLIVLANRLAPALRERYIVRRQRRVYVEREPDPPRGIFPDVTVARHDLPARSESSSDAGVATIEPVTLTLSMPEPRQETYLTLVDRLSKRVVTVIELLSPANKRAGGRGRREYRRKRDHVLESDAHLVEIDLLRGGARLTTIEPLPEGDYFAYVSRSERRPEVDVYPWRLAHRLPVIPLPLAGENESCEVDLQAIVTQAYDDICFDLILDYGAEVQPPLTDEETRWVRDVLGRRGAWE